MSRRIWDQVEETFETLFFGGEKLFGSGEDNPATATSPDRTRNAFISDKYEYSVLTGDRKSVRLLELLPGTRQHDIACTLTEYPLNGPVPSYDALSYVWGDVGTLTPIQINDRTLMVTSNLRTALLNIRKPDQPCTIWVDAVCIDQNNISERGHQVAIMGDIYRNAARTIVWLCDNCPPHTKKAFAIVEDLAAEAISRQSTGVQVDSDYSLTSLLSAERIESPNFERLKDDASVLHLACASWWFRTWTVQEVLLASEAVIMAGTYAMDWDRFCAGIDHGIAIGIWNPVLLGTVLDPVVIPYLSMSALRKKQRSRPQPSTTTPAQILLELLIQCRFRHASDPRDKVYALLGLKDPLQTPNQTSALGIEPDYTLSAAQVYLHTARQLLLHSPHNLNLLGASTPTTNLIPNLPTWVPDWSTTTPGPHPLMHDARGRARQTHASSHTLPAPSFLNINNNSILVLSGHEILTITRLAPALHRLRRDSSELVVIKRGDTLLGRLSALGQVFAHLGRVYWELSGVIPHLGTFEDWEALARECKSPGRQGGDGGGEGGGGYDPLAVYWQTLCTGTMVPGGREATARLFYAWRASLKSIFRLRRWKADSLLRPLAFVGYLMKTWREYSEFACLLEHVYERRLGCGGDGMLGLVPETTQVGDRVVLVKGGRQPLVLRRDGSDGEQGRYKFVGEAYVHGLMDGERFDEGKCVEMRIC